MILEGMYFEQAMMHSETRVYPQLPIMTSGLIEGMDSVYKYGLRESYYPTLSLVYELSDGMGNKINPGHYELALADDRQFLILIESKQPKAIIPVFKVETAMSTEGQVHDRKTLKEKKKRDKEIIKTNQKRAKTGMAPIDPDEDIYQQADIEYIKDGDYFLIRYERGDVKAWGAVKSH
jgi:hypothetical protein